MEQNFNFDTKFKFWMIFIYKFLFEAKRIEYLDYKRLKPFIIYANFYSRAAGRSLDTK
jgi:hypothetical protein